MKIFWFLAKISATISVFGVAAFGQWIQGVSSSVTPTSAAISWTSCASASANVSYGLTSAYGSSAVNAALSTAHAISLTGLQPSTTYHFLISDTDSAGATVAGTDKTFTTAATPPPPPATFTIGATAVFTTIDSGNANLLLAQEASSTQAGTIQSLSFYVTTVAGKLRLGIYDSTGPNGGPGKLLASTGEITPVKGWNTATVFTPVLLPIGNYWLANAPSSNSLSFPVERTSGTTDYYNFTYGAMPTTFSTSPNTTQSNWSFYATLSTSAPPPPPPTHSVTLNWTPSVVMDVTNYAVYRAVGVGAFTLLTPVGVGDVSTYTDNTVVSGSTYMYEVNAFDVANGWGGPSNVFTGVIP